MEDKYEQIIKDTIERHEENKDCDYLVLLKLNEEWYVFDKSHHRYDLSEEKRIRKITGDTIDNHLSKYPPFEDRAPTILLRSHGPSLDFFDNCEPIEDSQLISTLLAELKKK